MNSMKTAAIHCLGCKVNSYESTVLEQSLRNSGFAMVDFEDEADVYIVVSCAVTNVAGQKSRKYLRRAKKKNPQALVVALGCLAEVEKESLADMGIDMVVGNKDKENLPMMLEAHFSSIFLPGTVLENERERKTLEEALGKDDNATGSESRRTEIEGTAGKDSNVTGSEYAGKTHASGQYQRLVGVESHSRAYLKIEDGCEQFCSYCIVPYARGRIMSRPIREIVAEAKAMAEKGYREIVLTGINLSAYGNDPLLALLSALDEIPTLARIRLSSLEPQIITPVFIEALAKQSKICGHFHLSLQSGCDSVLSRMNRRYTTADYAEKAAIIRSFYHNPALTTDVIAGFPGETEEEFRRTYDFIESIAFSKLHVFKYSRRKGTPAAAMGGQVSAEIKDRRSEQLRVLSEQMAKDYRKSARGMKTTLIAEEEQVIDGVPYLTGYTDNYLRAALPARACGGTLVIGKLFEVCLGEEIDGKEVLRAMRTKA